MQRLNVGTVLRTVQNKLRCWSAQLKMRVHLLDLCCLLLEARSKRLNFLLLLRGIRLEVFSLLGDKRLLSTIKRGNIDL